MAVVVLRVACLFVPVGAFALVVVFGVLLRLAGVVGDFSAVGLVRVPAARRVDLAAGALAAGRGFLVSLINTGMGLPPVVVGLMVYLMLSASGPLGPLALLYTPTAMIIAQTILVTPIVAALTRQVVEDLHLVALAGGLGALLDGEGDDVYTAGNWSMGTGYWFGIGMLHDGNGDDDEEEGGGGEAAPTRELQPVPMSKNAGNRFVALLLDREVVGEQAIAGEVVQGRD